MICQVTKYDFVTANYIFPSKGLISFFPGLGQFQRYLYLGTDLCNFSPQQAAYHYNLKYLSKDFDSPTNENYRDCE